MNEVFGIDEMKDQRTDMLLEALRGKNPLTYEHSVRVAQYAEDVSRRLNLYPEDLSLVRTAALLHDIGKIAVPSQLLTKAELLTRAEFSEMQGHCRTGQVLLSRFHGFESVAEAVRHHHERWDGAGYPDGLDGETIPLASRVIHLTDSIDAMLNPRSYKDAYPVEWVLAEVSRCRGSQFDPGLVNVAMDWLRENQMDDLAAAKAA